MVCLQHSFKLYCKNKKSFHIHWDSLPILFFPYSCSFPLISLLTCLFLDTQALRGGQSYKFQLSVHVFTMTPVTRRAVHLNKATQLQLKSQRPLCCRSKIIPKTPVQFTCPHKDTCPMLKMLPHTHTGRKWDRHQRSALGLHIINKKHFTAKWKTACYAHIIAHLHCVL